MRSNQRTRRLRSARLATILLFLYVGCARKPSIDHVRIQYGSHDISVPLPVTIKWAGDTPVITITDMTIPGLGTYTARVLLYQDQYAGTWSSKDHGGQVFGRIVRQR